MSVMSFVMAPLDIPLVFILIAVILFILVGIYAGAVTFFTLSIPDGIAQLKANMLNRAIYMVHYSTSRCKMFCPSRNGKNGVENTLKLPKELGVKFDPSGSGLSEKFGKAIIYHGYSKSPGPFTSQQVKAIQDFISFCNEKGITVNEELIDAMVIHDLNIREVYTQPLLEMVMQNLPLPIRTEKEQWLNEDKLTNSQQMLEEKIADLEDIDIEGMKQKDIDDINAQIEQAKADLVFVQGKFEELDKLKELKQDLNTAENELISLKKNKDSLLEQIDIITGYLDPDTRKTIYTLSRLQDDLKKLVVRDGLFVYNIVHNFIFAASAATSAAVAEGINIAKAEALESNRNDDKGWNLVTLGTIVIFAIMLLVGAGLGFKMMSA